MLTNFLSHARDVFDDVFIDKIFDENATYLDLLLLAMILAVLIYAMFAILEPLLKRLATGPLHDIFWQQVEMEYDRPDKVQMREQYGVTTKQEYFDKFIVEHFPYSIVVFSQHIVGGLCTVPSVLGLEGFSASLRNSLACLGILIEIGYEIQDFARLINARIVKGKEEFSKAEPTIIVIFLCIHHSLSCLMGIPAIHSYRDLPELHRMVFDLQFAGGIMGLCGMFTATLDVTKKNQLRVFALTNFFMALLTAWTRVFDWFYLSYKLLARFFVDEKWAFLVFGGPVVLAFSFMNVFFIAIPTYQRNIKFLKKLVEFGSLTEDADESVRRSSTSDLVTAAMELSSGSIRLDQVFLSFYVDRHIERRHTFNSATLARSAALASSSAGDSRPARQSMMAWRSMPSRVKQRTELKMD